MDARNELIRYLGYEPNQVDPRTQVLLQAAEAEAISAVTQEVLRAGRAAALGEALAAIEDPERRNAAAAHFNMGSGLGWESARDVIRLMLASTAPNGLAPLRCARCGETDGPFKGTPADVLCETCINTGAAW